MIPEIKDYLSEQMLEVVSKSIKKKFQYKHLIDAVQKIEKEYKQTEFEHLLRQEEFDWDGLKQYIDDHLLSSISSVFLSPSQDVRKALRKQVYICAYSSAKANTVARQRQVDRLMDKVLIQVRTFLCEQQEDFEQVPFNEVTDQICVSLDTWGEEIKEIIEQQTQQLEEQFKKLQESLEYQHSFAKIVDHLKLPQPIHSLFHYRDPQVGFYGREKEIAYLDRFLDCEEPILFTAVNGPAGAGKSKFLYEYMKGLASNPNWKCLFLQSRQVLKKFVKADEWDYSVNLLVAIDYAGDYAELIGEWMVALKTGICPHKMRIVLLEREGVAKNRNDANMREKALENPMWYERLLAIHSNDDIRTMRYAPGEDTSFLELPTLSDDAFKQIIADYAKAANKKLSGQDQAEILDYCKTIERNEQGVSKPRPLILLFIVDAWEEGEHRRWNIQELLLRIIKRYKTHWETTLCAKNRDVYRSVERLLVYATATGGWKIGEQLPNGLQKDFLAVQNFCDTQKKIEQLFLGVNEKSEWDGILSPLEPDLIGELFVLDYLQDTIEYHEMIKAFNTNPKYLLFIFRSIVDYAAVDDYADLFGNGLRGLLDESLIAETPEFYAVLLEALIGEQKKESAIVTLEHLEELALDRQYADNKEIVLSYANGLYNLAFNQEVKEAEKTLEKLGELVSDSRYAANEEIVLVYANGLVNLTVNQEVKEAEKTVERLGELVSDNRYARNEEIVLEYANGLFNLTAVQKVKEAEKTVEKLRILASDSCYARNEEIVLEYVNGLYNLAFNQEVKEAEKTVEKLGELVSDSRYAANEEIVLIYAKSLVILAAAQEVKETEKTVERLGELVSDSRYAGNEEIVLRYAKSLFNLVVAQEVKEAEKTVERLGKLVSDSRYAANEEIVLIYAKGLYKLAFNQEVKEAEKTVERLGELVSDSRYAGNEEIVLRYARSLFNLVAAQEMKEAEKTVERLGELVSNGRYVEYEEIVLIYAKGLFNLIAAQEVKEAEKTVKVLGELVSNSRYVDNEEIVLIYANGLAILGVHYYLQHNYEKAEKNFSKARQMGSKIASANLCYMIRHHETKMFSPSDVKEILLPLLNDNNPFVVMNMALYLAEYENNWQSADDMIFTSAETEDFSDVIKWWSSLDDAEGLLVMTWLERNKICKSNYTLKAKETLELFRGKYPNIPDWIVEIREPTTPLQATGHQSSSTAK